MDLAKSQPSIWQIHGIEDIPIFSSVNKLNEKGETFSD